MNVSVWWEVYVLKRGVTVRTRTLTSFINTPTPVASHHVGLCCFWQSCKMRKGLQSRVHETCLQVLALSESKKSLAWACSPVYRRGVVMEADLQGRRSTGCVWNLEKEPFKSTFQSQTKWAWFTLDLSCLNFQHPNSCICQPSYQRR